MLDTSINCDSWLYYQDFNVNKSVLCNTLCNGIDIDFSNIVSFITSNCDEYSVNALSMCDINSSVNTDSYVHVNDDCYNREICLYGNSCIGYTSANSQGYLHSFNSTAIGYSDIYTLDLANDNFSIESYINNNIDSELLCFSYIDLNCSDHFRDCSALYNDCSYNEHTFIDHDVCRLNSQSSLYISSDNDSDSLSLSNISDHWVFNPRSDDHEVIYGGDMHFPSTLQVGADISLADDSDVNDDCHGATDPSNPCVSKNYLALYDDNVNHNANIADLVWDNYGYIPEYFEQYNGNSVVNKCNGVGIEWLYNARSCIKITGCPNYSKARIEIPSNFNFDLWSHYLKDYWDVKIIDYLRFGFPLSVNKQFEPVCEIYNHSSATKFNKHVKDYMDTEVSKGAMLGPFDHKPFTDLHMSPMLSRPKTADSRRIIVDLSWKENKSLNANVFSAYDGVNYILRYPSLDIIQRRILHLGHSAMIYKIDISRAFRNLPVDPGDAHLLGLNFNDKYYVDLAIPFGYIHGSACCQRVTDAIRFICFKHGYWLFNYCDDLIGIELPSRVKAAFDFTSTLIEQLGFPINLDKLVAPAGIVTCIGIEVSVPDMLFRIPSDKLFSIKDLCYKWSYKVKASKKQYQSLLGKLLYISKCIKYARIFMGRMLKLFRQQHSSKLIYLDNEFHKDLRWFNTFLDDFNGIVFLDKPVQHTIYVDASFLGVGAYFDGKVYSYGIPDSLNGFSIAHLELINVLVAIRRWSNIISNSVVQVYCDNIAVVEVLNNYRIRDDIMLTIVRNIWMELARFNVNLVAKHIPGVSNIYADILSRWSAKNKFSSVYVNALSKCDWFNINDSYFNLNSFI